MEMVLGGPSPFLAAAKERRVWYHSQRVARKARTRHPAPQAPYRAHAAGESSPVAGAGNPLGAQEAPTDVIGSSSDDAFGLWALKEV